MAGNVLSYLEQINIKGAENYDKKITEKNKIRYLCKYYVEFTAAASNSNYMPGDFVCFQLSYADES